MIPPIRHSVSGRRRSWDAFGTIYIGGGPHSSDQERALLRWSLLGLFSS